MSATSLTRSSALPHPSTGTVGSSPLGCGTGGAEEGIETAGQMPKSRMSRSCMVRLRFSSLQVSTARAQASRADCWKPSCS